jgi:hypothetical protein
MSTKDTYRKMLEMTKGFGIGHLRGVSRVCEDDAPLVRVIRRKADEMLRIKLLEQRAQRRAEAVAWADKVRDCLDRYGVLYVEHWQRDCDMCEANRLREFTSHDEFFKWREDQVLTAEGPMCFELLTPEEADEFRPHTRDRALEA